MTETIPLKVEFASCPVEASLGVLGRKWALLILRDIALFQAQRFNEMLRTTPGMSKRVLSRRLMELEKGGFIFREEQRLKYTRWQLTEKGRDVLPVLLTLVRLGAKWYPQKVFSDRQPRALNAIFDKAYVQRTLGELSKEGRTSRRARTSSLTTPSSLPAGDAGLTA